MDFTQQYKVMHEQKTVLGAPGENVYSRTQDGPACGVSEFRAVLWDPMQPQTVLRRVPAVVPLPWRCLVWICFESVRSHSPGQWSGRCRETSLWASAVCFVWLGLSSWALGHYSPRGSLESAHVLFYLSMTQAKPQGPWSRSDWAGKGIQWRDTFQSHGGF